MAFYLESSNFFGTLKRKCYLVWVCQSTNFTKTNKQLILLHRIIFSVSIFLPTLAVYAHELSHHEHQKCNDTTVHFHEYKENCCLDNFIVIKNYSFSVKNYKSLVFIFNLEIFEIKWKSPMSRLPSFCSLSP